MITPEQFDNIDDITTDVNLKKLEDLSPETRASIERGMLQAKEGKLTTRSFVDRTPNDTTIAAINEERDELESYTDFDGFLKEEGILENCEEVAEERVINYVNIGTKNYMTHQERQEWWRSSGLLERLGVDMGEPE